MARANTDVQAAFRLLPAIDEVLRDPRADGLVRRSSRDLVQELATAALDAWRAEIRSGTLDADKLLQRIREGTLFADLAQHIQREAGRGVVRCINATGVVLNTGLGRAPVHPEVAARMAVAAQSYCILEVDRETNQRNQRDDHLGTLLTRLTGAEAGLAVNNCAGAVLLAFQTFAGGREAVVSRGELVEIGGSFRVPDVMARANAKLVEVGTTNRTRRSDYENAINEHTGLLVKVHTSNFRLVGFTEEVSAGELADLGRPRHIVTMFDLGSGLLECAGAPDLAPILGDEPLVRAAVKSGVDIVCFSGDKLLGAPQAGLIVGTRAAINALRKNPIYRALRLDKVTLAGVEATLDLILHGRGSEIPARRMLTRDIGELRTEAETIAARLKSLGYAVEVVAESSQPGSGSAPGVLLDTFCVAVRHASMSADALALALRRADPPVFARIQDERILLDPRTLLPGDATDLARAFERVSANSKDGGRVRADGRPGSP